MKARVMLLAAVSAIVAAGGVALAQDYDDGYRYHAPYDDQAEETRRLNLLQLQNPGAGEDAVPPPGGELRDMDDDDDDGMGGPSFSRPPSPGDMGDDDDFPGPDPDVDDDDDGPMGPGGDVDDDDDRY